MSLKKKHVISYVVWRVPPIGIFPFHQILWSCKDPTLDGDLNDSSYGFPASVLCASNATVDMGPSSHLPSIAQWKRYPTLGCLTHWGKPLLSTRELDVLWFLSIHSIFRLGWSSYSIIFHLGWSPTEAVHQAGDEKCGKPQLGAHEAPGSQRTPKGFIAEWHRSGSVLRLAIEFPEMAIDMQNIYR